MHTQTDKEGLVNDLFFPSSRVLDQQAVAI